LAIFFAVSSVAFAFLQQPWCQWRHGDAQQQNKTILLPFWVARPAAWFAFAESKFRENAVFSQEQRFNLLLAAMPEKILDQIMDKVENVPEDSPYEMLNACLLETHTLSDQEKMDVLFKSEPLVGQKPSQMMANMLAYCPFGMEQSIMFHYMFLRHLPVTLQTLLGEQEPRDIKAKWS
jgi:hypothetical protein